MSCLLFSERLYFVISVNQVLFVLLKIMAFAYFHTDKLSREDVLTHSLIKYGCDSSYFHIHELAFIFEVKPSHLLIAKQFSNLTPEKIA